MATEIRLSYDPYINPKQVAFHTATADEVVYGGAKGGGKSCALVMDALNYGQFFPGANVYLFRESYEELESNLIEEWKAKVPRELYAYHESKHIATLRNSSKVYFRYLAGLDDAYTYSGRSIDYIGIDELTRHTEKAVQLLLSCLRSPKGFPPRFRATCNPGGIGHLWVKKRYITPTGHGAHTVTDGETGNTLAFIPAKVYDNPAIMENDPAYVKRLQNLPEVERRAFLEGDWDVFAGQVFGEWRHDTHVVEPRSLPPEWMRFRAMDWGYAKPFSVGWYAVDYDGRLWRYREWYGCTGKDDEGVRLEAGEVARGIAERERGENVAYGVLDPSCWAKTGHTGPSIAETLNRAGLRFRPGDNERLGGKQQVHSRLKLDCDNLPGLYVFSACLHFIRTIPALCYDAHRVEDVDTDAEDHIYDELRYACMSRPLSPRLPEKPVWQLPLPLRTPERRPSGYLEW